MNALKLGLLTLALLLTMSAAAQAQPNDPVPSEYQPLYDTLSGQLDKFDAFLGTQPTTATVAPVFGAELLPANGNRGEALLSLTSVATVRQYLDQLQAIGVAGVTVQISFPLLLDDFPRSSDYLAFYKIVAAEVRKRGLKLLVETGPAFSGTQFSSVSYDYSQLTTLQYFARRINALVTIAAQIQPDYLAIGEEISTEEMITGKRFGVDEYALFVHQAALQIHQANDHVLVGAGVGIWEDPAYVQRFLTDSALDTIGIHIYPLATPNRDLLQDTYNLATQIKAAGKQVIVGEAWLYKAAPADLGTLDFTQIYSRDVYSFWSPLDSRFIDLITKMAQLQGFAYTSFFWSSYFFGYLNYADVPAGTSPVDVFAQANRVAYANMANGVLSPTGEAYKQLLAGGV